MTPESINQVVAVGAIVLQIVTLGLLVAYLLRRQYAFFEDVVLPVAQWGLWIGLITSLFGAAMSLFYSEIIGFAPCVLCWWQRIFMYPQVILFALALYLRDRQIAIYSIALSIFGLGIGLYNHMLQIMPAGTLPCPAQGPSCSQLLLFEFGYITFPFLAVTLFAFLIVVMLIVRARE